jgi:hypothetical protein
VQAEVLQKILVLATSLERNDQDLLCLSLLSPLETILASHSPHSLHNSTPLYRLSRSKTQLIRGSRHSGIVSSYSTRDDAVRSGKCGMRVRDGSQEGRPSHASYRILRFSTSLPKLAEIDNDELASV